MSTLEVEPWDGIPEHASDVIHVQRSELTIQELADIVDEVQPGFGGFVKSQSSSLGMVISNPELTGVDMFQDWYATVFAVGGSETEELLPVPATDASAMRDAIGAEYKFLEHDGWLVCAKTGKLIEQVGEYSAGERSGV